MADHLGTFARRDAIVGMLAGLVLAAGAVVASGALGQIVPQPAAAQVRAAVPGADEILPTPEPSDCEAFPPPNPYPFLEQHRPDVLRFYASNGWDPRARCRDIFDDWLGQARDGQPPTTAQAYVAAKGWAAPMPTPTPPADCVAPADAVARAGFDPYAILARERPGVVARYTADGWDAATQCAQMFDDWTAKGPDGHAPTTVAAYVAAQGWAPKTRQATPTPLPGCRGPAELTAKLGFDPYAILSLNRPDVLRVYSANGWHPSSQCVDIYDDWLKHPDGRPATTAAQFVDAAGWAQTAQPGSTAPVATSGSVRG